MTGDRPRLRREDWILAGQELLREGGVPAVRLAPLAERLGVTTGSFYHHFRDVSAYLDALADHFGAANVARVLGALEAVRTPQDRLRVMWELAQERDVLRLDSAMRVWATTSERARAAVTALDEGLLEVIREAFVDLGFSPDEARVRALMAFSAGVGLPLLFGRTGMQQQDPFVALGILAAGAPAHEAPTTA